jgi:hypothetical protein
VIQNEEMIEQRNHTTNFDISWLRLHIMNVVIGIVSIARQKVIVQNFVGHKLWFQNHQKPNNISINMVIVIVT